MNRNVIISALVFALSVTAEAQSIRFDDFKKVRTVSGAYTSFSVDNLDNVYLLSTSNQLKKLDSNGDSVAVFNDVKKFGEATLMDVSNPLKILLYYKNFSTIVVLDGMLQQKNMIDLRKKNMFRVSAVGLGYDGKIWVYDELEFSLKKIDDKGNVILRTPDLRQVFDELVTPVNVFDQNKYLYLYDPQKGIYVFDYYGTFKNKIDIKGWENLRVVDKHVYGKDSTSFYSYEIPVFKYNKTSIPRAFAGYQQIFTGSNYFYGLSAEGLDIINIKQ